MKRNSKGQFVKRGGKRRGMGSIITIRRGMGAIPGGPMGEAIIPALVGALVTGATALGLRYFVDPNAGTTQRFAVKWAPFLGHAAGIVASLGLALLGGRSQGMRAASASFTAATGVGLALFGSDMLWVRRGGSFAAALAPSAEEEAAASEPPPATEEEAAVEASQGAAGLARYRRARRRLGTGAIVPEYARSNGMGAVVMEPVGPSGRRAGSIGSYGETVTLQGINTGAFGTPGFTA